MLRDRDWGALRRYAAGEDERSVEMRHMSVFTGVLSEDERRSVLDAVYAELDR
ncbi:hypothetical protein [Microbacterium aurum]